MDKIKLAAVRCDSGLIFTGRNHADCIMTAVMVNSINERFSQDKQGFITDKHKFVDRKEAAQIAFDAGQIKKETDILFSEDITGDWGY